MATQHGVKLGVHQFSPARSAQSDPHGSYPGSVPPAPQPRLSGDAAAVGVEGPPLAKSNILRLLAEHEESVLRPQVERAVERAKQIILEGAGAGKRNFDFVLCRRDKDEVDDVWQQRQRLLWEGLAALGLEDFQLRHDVLDRGREGIALSVSF
eukprot:TRINITY_DN70876_c0_g1_i1.p1 TRINITY_DN70876_c0_g1~~TRINITY_DN70876_c0_g1_i1.p1  ORF type:complete len:178 (+),score=37.30 TRINITY_DN70876_c0_g1_i1:78-536(+)